jgi:hypothetical protein
MPANAATHARSRPSAARTLLLVLSGSVALATGCGPSDPLDAKVSATDSLSLAMARSEAEHHLAPEQLADFDKAIEEIKLHIMGEGTAHGGDAVMEAMLEKVNGQTLRSVIQMGLGWELSRAEFERSTLEKSMATNALMRTRPGDTDSATYLSDLRERQAVRLGAATEEVNHVRKRLAASALPPPSPAPMSSR